MDSHREKLLQETYDKFIQLMLYDFPVERISEIVVDDVTGYGTTIDERVLEVKRFAKIVTDQREQGVGIEIKTKLMPMHRRKSPEDDVAVFMDELEISMQIKDNVHIVPVRLTSVFEFQDNAWKLVHIHGSTAVETEEDTWHLNEWKQKTEKLERMIEEKTADLNIKNRELEIEAALERVRTIAMAMRKPEDMLKVCKTISLQLQKLGVKEIRNVQTAIFYQQRGTYMNYEYYTKHKKTFITDTSYTNHKIAKAFAAKMMKGKNQFYITHIKGKRVKEWIAYQKTTNVFVDKFLNTASSLNYYWYSLGPVALGISTYLPLIENEINLFKRFLKVFELAYRRYLDIEKAFAQAREAQIEAALERVRSKTMAMYKSEQLAETAKVLFEQSDLLGIYIDRMSIAIINEKTHKAEFWLTDQVGNKLNDKYFFSLDEPTSMTKIYKAWQNRKDSIVVDLKGKELSNWLKFINENVKLPINVSNIKDRRVHQAAFFSSGFLMFTTSEPINEERVQILIRFAKVFDLTYTRFQDLQKAEAQTRESEIQLALERVRARTLAMQNSEELVDTAAIVFQQLIHLGIEPNRIYIAIIKDDDGKADFWITDEDGSKVSSGFHPNLSDNRSFLKMLSGWKEKRKSLTVDMHGEELTEYLSYLTKQNVPLKGGLSQKRRLQYVAYFSKGFIGVASPDETKPETLQLLERFAAVFNLTYTRFNDLLQTEAQNKIIQSENERKTKELEDARELQISMLPKELPRLPHLDIAVYMKTATEVGGDYYDYSIDVDGTLTFILGDATGHGMMSGMMVSIMKSFFIANRKNIELKEFFESSNNSIKDMKLGRLMMALSGIQITSQKVIATNAGMPSLIYFRNKSQKAGEFVSHNFPLGAMTGNRYSLKEINYESGDILLLMSDGFAELKNGDNEQYGYPRVINEFRSVVQKSSEEIVEHFKNSANGWMNGREPEDDITFLVIKIK